jgi:hypothetical protein
MADEESLRQVAQSRAPFSSWLGIVILFALFGVIVLATVGPAPRGDSYEQTRAKKRADKLKALHEEDAKALATYAWVDKTKGVTRIPIDHAMELTVAELAQKKPAPAGPIAPSQPEAPSASASPSPSATRAASPTAGATAQPKAVTGVESANRGQPAAATNPAPVKPGTQPGASATPAASPAVPPAKSAVSPSATPAQSSPSPNQPR